jgi:hypothetical protein
MFGSETPTILLEAMRRRTEAGLALRVTFNDGSPGFTKYCLDATQRDETAARFAANRRVASVTVL